MEKNNDPFEKESEKDEDIIDLTEKASSLEDEDDIIELSETFDPPASESEEDILDLTEPVIEDDLEDEGVLDLVDLTEPVGDQEEILDLMEPVIEDDPVDEDVFDLVNLAEPAGDQEEIFVLAEPALQESLDGDEIIDIEDDILDLEVTVEPFSEENEEDEILDLSDIDDGSLEDAIASSEQVEGLEPESEDNILNLTEEAEEAAGGIPEEMPSIVVPGPSDDQEILDLIDDIQSTLDETDSAAEGTGVEQLDSEEVPSLVDEMDEASIDPAVLVGNGDPIDADDLKEIDTELLDNLGIDLTSELNRDILSNDDEKESIADKDEDIPFEAADSTLGDRVEKIVEQVVHEKLKAMVDKRIQEAVQKEFEKLRKDILD